MDGWMYVGMYAVSLFARIVGLRVGDIAFVVTI